jgi:hypothetical protein
MFGDPAGERWELPPRSQFCCGGYTPEADAYAAARAEKERKQQEHQIAAKNSGEGNPSEPAATKK